MFVTGAGLDSSVRVLFPLPAKKNDINIHFCCSQHIQYFSLKIWYNLLAIVS